MTIEQYHEYLEKSFDAFCKAVIRNEAINLHRQIAVRVEKEQPLSTLSHSELARFCYDDTYHLYKKVYYVQETPVVVYDQTLGEVLQFLSPWRRDVILLKYFLDYSDTDIAKLLHISSPTVSRRMTSALKKLKELLEGMGDA